MSERKDGGAAFPCPHPSAPELGMSLRDYFAAAALQGVIAGYAGSLNKLGETIGTSTQDGVAQCAYAYADAMIKERDK